MSTQSDQINDALTVLRSALDDAADAGPYNADLGETLDDITGLLQTVQNDLLEKSEQALLDALNANNAQLQKLNADIDKYVTSLGQTAVTIKKVSNAISIAVNVISAVVSAGII
jgi:predicted component of type VI protein secretion system